MHPVLSVKKYNKIKKFLPTVKHGPKRDHRMAISGMICVFKNGLPWRFMPEIYGKWYTVYNLFNRWSRKGIFREILAALNVELKKRHVAMIDSTSCKVHRTAASLKSDGKPRQIGRSRGGLNTKIHLICNDNFQPLDFKITPGQESDTTVGHEMVSENLHRMKDLLADRAYDANKTRNLLARKKVSTCIPPKSNRIDNITYDRTLYKQRHKIENMFGWLKDWRGVALRCHRNAHTFESLVCLGLVVKFLM